MYHMGKKGMYHMGKECMYHMVNNDNNATYSNSGEIQIGNELNDTSPCARNHHMF